MKPVFKKLLLGVAILISGLLYFFFDARQGGFPPCPFYFLTGWFCPGCGSQRALSALLHGSIFEALHYNVIMILFLPLLLYSAIISFVNAGVQKMRLWYNPLFVKIVLIMVVCFWIFRNIPLYPFSVLAPSN